MFGDDSISRMFERIDEKHAEQTEEFKRLCWRDHHTTTNRRACSCRSMDRQHVARQHARRTFEQRKDEAMPATATLPDKPSELIRVALADLRKCEADERYEIDMSEWHLPDGDGGCFVCLAGAVMAKSLGAEEDDEVTPDNYFLDECGTERKLRALDDFRCGGVRAGLRELGIPMPPMPPTCRPSLYHESPVQFHADMHALADELERHGL